MAANYTMTERAMRREKEAEAAADAEATAQEALRAAVEGLAAARRAKREARRAAKEARLAACGDELARGLGRPVGPDGARVVGEAVARLLDGTRDADAMAEVYAILDTVFGGPVAPAVMPGDEASVADSGGASDAAPPTEEPEAATGDAAAGGRPPLDASGRRPLPGQMSIG